MSTQRSTRPLPGFFIGKDSASERVSNFRNSKHPLLSGALGRTDTKSIWYSLKHFEDIFKELVFLDADGIRVYFGEYAADHADFPGQLCLVMVPTRQNAELGHEDIILEEEEDFGARPGSELFLGNDQEKGFNYGSPCPPVCPKPGESKYPVT